MCRCGSWILTEYVFDRLVSFEGSLLRMMMKVKRKHSRFGLEDFVTWRRRHTRMVRAYSLKSVVLIIVGHCLGGLFDYTCNYVRGKSDRHILTFRAACAWKSQKWWKTQQAVGTQTEPKRRRICDVQNPYWRHSQPGKKAKQWTFFVLSPASNGSRLFRIAPRINSKRGADLLLCKAFILLASSISRIL